jgi:dipeptidyl aminopeptidase/acylaminoacyl peptidase
MARHDAPDSAESHLLGAPILTVPDKMRAASPLTYVRKGAPPFLIMHGLADNAVPYHQSVMLYKALTARHNDATLRLIDGLPHGFFDRSDTDDLAGPVRMQVSESHHSYEPPHYEQARVFDTALAFFKKHLG